MMMKVMLYMMTGNIYFLFLPMQMALMMMMISGQGGATALGTSGGINTASLSSMLPLMLMGGSSGGGYKRRYSGYSRPRTIVVNRRYGYRRY